MPPDAPPPLLPRAPRGGDRLEHRRLAAVRDLVRNGVELDMFARALHPTALAGGLPVLLLCDMAAAFPSVSRRWLRAVLERLAIRDIEVLNASMVLMLSMGGVATIGLVTSGIAQGCPLSGVLFVCAADPIAVVSCGKSGMLRQCADDTVVLLRSARLLSSFVVCRGRPLRTHEAEAGKISERAHRLPPQRLREGGGPPGSRRIVAPSRSQSTASTSALGMQLGPGAHGESWAGPLSKWRAIDRWCLRRKGCQQPRWPSCTVNGLGRCLGTSARSSRHRRTL